MSCPVVSTRKGKVRGSLVKLVGEDAKPVGVYRNIPFAKPPVGNLRFLAPEPANAWDGVRDGTVQSKQPQQNFDFDRNMAKYLPFYAPEETLEDTSEDCLNLSVYVPQSIGDKKLPVMVWIYGGAFQNGANVIYDGSALAGFNDVIVVVPNYRVGVFGFLSLDVGSVCPGNAGLFDQKLALEWVKENIAAFGGDKDNVTIFGESAGAISVHFHVISPLSSGLFHKAISHSGQATMPGLTNDENRSKKALMSLVERMGIRDTNDRNILQALQNASASDLLRETREMSMKELLVFQPTVDGVYLQKTPDEYLQEKYFANKVPYIIGCNNTEGQGVAGMVVNPNFIIGMTEEEIKNAPYLLMSDAKYQACKKFYMKDETDDKRFSKLLGDIVGGSMFIGPAIRAASQYSEAGAAIYAYYGTFRLRMFHEEEYGKDVAKKPDWCICDHIDDTPMMLGFAFNPGKPPYGAKYSEEEKRLSRECMAYITNFAKHGDPNKGAAVPVTWPRYKNGGDHLILNHPVSVGKVPSEGVKFWNETMAGMK